MEQFKRRVETAISAADQFRALLDDIKSMSRDEKTALLQVVDIVEQRILAEERDPGTRRRATVWTQVLGVLTMGLDFSAQALIHKTLGAGTNREVVLGRIETIRGALTPAEDRS